jgi:hypothetical protein
MGIPPDRHLNLVGTGHLVCGLTISERPIGRIKLVVHKNEDSSDGGFDELRNDLRANAVNVNHEVGGRLEAHALFCSMGAGTQTVMANLADDISRRKNRAA